MIRDSRDFHSVKHNLHTTLMILADSSKEQTEINNKLLDLQADGISRMGLLRIMAYLVITKLAKEEE